MQDRIRVKDKDTGHERTIGRQELPHGNYQELKADAVDPLTGLDLPPVHFEAPGREDADGYAGLKVGELKDEIDRRNDQRGDEATQISKAGKKADLVAALEADDAGTTTELQQENGGNPEGHQADTSEGEV